MLNLKLRGLLGPIALVFVLNIGYGQTINTPNFTVGFACPNPGFTSFGVYVSYTAPGFADPNAFSIELSDANGVFNDDSPVVIASGITTENKTIAPGGSNEGFTTSVTLPTNVYGDGYKIRVRASNPAVLSPPSDPGIPLYYTEPITPPMSINGGATSYVICSGESVVLTLDNSDFPLYQWYKNFMPFNPDGSTDPTGNSITVSDSGNYYASVYYGPCTAGALANSIALSVTISPNSVTAAITEPSQAICAGDALTLNATPSDVTNDYTWYKDNVEIANGIGLMAYTVSATDPFGDYTVEILNTSGCSDISPAVTISNSGTSINLSTSTPAEQILLPGDNITLSVASDTAGSTIEWFLNGGMTPVSTAFDFVTSATGSYQATVTGPGACADIKQSPIFNVYAPQTYVVDIAVNSGYLDCGTDPATVSVTGITATANAGTLSLSVNSGDFASFSYQWYKDASILAGEIGLTTTINDRTGNGDYMVDATYGATAGNSNPVAINLGLEAISISSPLIQLCPDSEDSIDLSSNEALNALYNYQWYKNGTAIVGATGATLNISDIGSYELVASAFGCTSTSNAIVISYFNVNGIVISPSEFITIAEGASQVVVASGANDYVWTNDSTGFVTNGDTITVTDEGTYTLVAKSGNCMVTKTITVEFRLSGLIQNAITPNADNINDTWTLPGGFNSDRVEVVIYDSNGKTVLQTTNYNNNWPSTPPDNIKNSPVFYYVISKDDVPVKKGTISVVQ